MTNEREHATPGAAGLAVEQLRDRFDDVNAAISARTKSAVPECAAMARSDPDRYGAVLRHLVRVGLDALAGGRRLSDQERAGVAEIGRSAASEGLTLAAVQTAIAEAIAVGEEHLFDALAQVAGAGGGSAGPRAIARPLRALEFDLLRAVEAGFGWHADDTEGPQPAREALLVRLVEGRIESYAVRRRAAALRVHIDPPLHLVVFVEGADVAPGALRERTARCARALGSRATGPALFAATGEHPELAVVVAPSAALSRPQALAKLCQQAGLAAVHAAAGDASALAHTFRRLRDVTPIARRCCELLGAVVALDALLHYRLAHSLVIEEQEALLRQVLGPFMLLDKPDTRAKLLDTLRVMLVVGRARSLAEVARDLNVVHNTVRYRVHTIERLTGLSVTRDWLRFSMALSLLDLWADGLSPPGDPWWSPATR